MVYAKKYLKSIGIPATIIREEEVATKVSIVRATSTISDVSAREAYWEGMSLREDNIISGEYLMAYKSIFLVQTVQEDFTSMQDSLFLVKCNTKLDIERFTEALDEEMNIIKDWIEIDKNIHSYINIVTAKARQEDPGLLENTRYVAQIPVKSGIELQDRVIHKNKNYEVVSIDDIGMQGVIRVQLSIDLRE